MTASIESTAPDIPEETYDMSEDSCDLIETKDKTLISARVKEINQYYVLYKECDDPEGPVYQIPKSTISRITFANGLLQSFNFSEEEESPQDTVFIEDSADEIVQKEYPMAKHAVIAGGCSFIPVVGWVFGILAIVFGTTSLSKIQRYPEKYTGKGKALTGLILGISGLVAGFIIFMITVYEEFYF